MDSPRIILRFRNVTSSKDTITEHQRIIEEHGFVYWGWWKKFHEKFNEHLFGGEPSSIYIINTSEKKLYLAHYVESFLTKNKCPESSKVPEYYRDNIVDIAGWFKLYKIEELDYDLELENIIGESTFSQYIRVNFNENNNFNFSEDNSDKNSVLHLSDLHFGKDHAFHVDDKSTPFNMRSLSNVILNDIMKLGLYDDIQAIIITGDLTTQGDWSTATRDLIVTEIHKISDALKVAKKDILICPGNHDIVRYKPEDLAKKSVDQINVDLQKDQEHEFGFRYFNEKVTGRHRDRESDLDRIHKIALKNANIFLCLLNSCRVAGYSGWTEYGYVGQVGEKLFKETAELVKKSSKKFNIGIMALHHHLLPVSGIEFSKHKSDIKGVSMTLDAVQLLDAACEYGIKIALHGHQHHSRVTRYEKLKYSFENSGTSSISIVSSGSSGVHKSRRADSMNNSYSILTAKDNNVVLKVREINNDGQLCRYLFDDVILLAQK